MAAIAIRKFLGEIPKLASTPHMLPDGAAREAVNCDFTKGALYPLRKASLEITLTGPPVVEPGGYPAAAGQIARSMYKQVRALDGSTRWVSYNTQYERMYKGPVIDDIHERIYHVVTWPYPPWVHPQDPSIFAVFPLSAASTTGGEPANGTAWHVGCPAPTVAPVITSYDLTDTIPGVKTPLVEIRGWWEAEGTRWQEKTLFGAENTGSSPPTGATFMREWTVTMDAPAETTDPETEEETGVPSTATFGAELILRDSTTVLFRVSTSENASAPAKSTAFPGGVELTIAKSSTSQASFVYTLRLTWGIFETRAYLFTCVNEWNEESGPSPPTLVSINYLQKVRIACNFPSFREYIGTGTPTVYHFKPRAEGAAGINIYRTFGGSADYLKITNPSASASTKYDHLRLSTGEPGAACDANNRQTQNAWSFVMDEAHTPGTQAYLLPTIGWRVPPRNLRGLTQMPNGWFAAFGTGTTSNYALKNVLYMCEPYRPHTWQYSMTFEKDIIGICAGSQFLVVATTEALYVVSGVHPAAVSQMKLAVPSGGVSYRAMCNVEGAVAVATYDGIVMVNGSNATLSFSQNLFTREEWLSRYKPYLQELVMTYNDGHLVGMFQSINGFVVRTDEAAGAFSQLGIKAYAVARIPPDDATVFSSGQSDFAGDVVAASGLNVFRLFGHASAYMSCSWWSKDYLFPKPESIGGFYVRMNSGGAVMVSLYVEGVEYYTVAVGATGHYRVPAARRPADGHLPVVASNIDGRGFRWSVKLVSSVPVHEFVMAQTMAELRSA